MRRHDIVGTFVGLLGVLASVIIAISPNPALAASNYSQNFNSGTASGWSSGNDSYAVTSGYYTNGNDQLANSIATYGGDTWTTNFTYSLQMSSQFGGGTANAVGAVYGYQDANDYYYVWFNMQGSAELFKVANGTSTQLAQVAFSMTINTWFTVQIVRDGANTSVLANGLLLFNQIPQPEITAPGRIGVFAAWNFGKFDNVAVTLNGADYTQSFATTPSDWSSANATYSATSGYYTNGNGAGAQAAYTVATYNSATWQTNFTYDVQIDTEYGSSTAPGNAVGAVYGYQDASDYYVAWCNALGSVELLRFTGGTPTTVATGSFSSNYGAHIFLNVRIIRSGTNTSILVNGNPVIVNVSQPEISAPGKIGVFTNFSYGKFANVVVAGSGVYAQGGPPFPRTGTLRLNTTQDFEQTSVQQQIAAAQVAVFGYWKGWDAGETTSMNQIIQNVKADATPTSSLPLSVPSYPTKIFLYSDISEMYMDTGYTSSDVIAELNAMKWWLYESDDSTVVVSPLSTATPHSYLTNLTENVPLDGNKEDWAQWYANWLGTNFYTPVPSMDGMYVDNLSVKPLASGDWYDNRTTANNTDSTVEATFRTGFRQHEDTLRSLMPTKMQIGNIGDWGDSTAQYAPQYTNMLNGGVIEGMLGTQSWAYETQYGWSAAMGYYSRIMAATMPPKLVMFQSSEYPTDYQSMRYGLTSCLMDDGYYTFSAASTAFPDGAYDNTLHFDEFSARLGYPIQPPPLAAWQNGVWRRDFQNGIALVNPRTANGSSVTVTLETTYVHINGSQDSTVNNGAAVTSVTLGNGDGVILLRQWPTTNN